MNINDEDALGFFNRLLDWLHQADLTHFGSHIQLVYVASGAQHVGSIQTQNVYVERRQEPAKTRKQNEGNTFDKDTPLSALFRENHHEELRKVIDSWRPYLIDDDPMVDALDMTSFRFDFSKVIATSIYIDLGRLLYNHTMVDDNMNKLAWYLFLHTNLSQSQATLHAQLRKYKKR